MSLKNRFEPWTRQEARNSLTKILLFQYSYTDISATVGIRGTVIYALESTWLVVYCVLNSKPHLFRGLRKSPLNIETIEFCWWAGKIGLGRGPDKIVRSSLTKFFCFNIHTLISQQQQGWRNNDWCVRKHVTGCVLCAQFKATPIPRERKSPLNIETIEFC